MKHYDLQKADFTRVDNSAPIPDIVGEDIETNDVTGFVSNCKRLNVRKRPDITAPVVCEIDSNSQVIINDNESTDDFYKISTAFGVEGFCMKKFIAVYS